MSRKLILPLLFFATVLTIAPEAHADLRLPSYSEKYPVQTGLIGAALALVVAAAGFLTLKMASDRKARGAIAVLILIFTGLAAVSYRQLFAVPKNSGSSGLTMLLLRPGADPLTSARSFGKWEFPGKLRLPEYRHLAPRSDLPVSTDVELSLEMARTSPPN